MNALVLFPKKGKSPQSRRPKNIPTPFTPELRPAVHPLPRQLQTKLAKLRLKLQTVRVGEALSVFVSAIGMLLAAQMFTDWLLNLSFFTRALLLIADLTGLFWFVSKKILPLIKNPPTQRQCALLVEKAWPNVMRGALIASVQLAEPGITENSGELVQLLHRQTTMKTAPLNFKSIVKSGPVFRILALSAALCLAILIIFARTWPASLSLLERVILLPVKVPRSTEVICLTGSESIGIGASVVIEAQAVGTIPAQGQLTIIDESGEQRNVVLERETDHPDKFEVQIDDVQKSFSYSIQLNDGTSDLYTIRTATVASLASISFNHIFPAYTELPPIKRNAGDLALLSGSRLQLQAVASSGLRNAEIKLVGVDQSIAMTLDSADPRKASGEIFIPAPGLGLKGFFILLTNEEGLTSGADKQYSIEVIADHPPEIKITLPKRPRELCTLNLKPKISFSASDDFGLAQIDLVYRVISERSAAIPETNEAVSGQVQRENIEMDQEHPKNREGDFTWDLSTVQPPLKPGITVEYWLRAQDDNDATGPGVTESEHQVIKIVNDTEKRAEIMTRLMESLNGITDLSKNQEMLNQQLKDALQGKENGNR